MSTKNIIRLLADRLSETPIIGCHFQTPVRRAHLTSVFKLNIIVLCACSNIHLSDYRRVQLLVDFSDPRRVVRTMPIIGYSLYFGFIMCFTFITMWCSHLLTWFHDVNDSYLGHFRRVLLNLGASSDQVLIWSNLCSSWFGLGGAPLS